MAYEDYYRQTSINSQTTMKLDSSIESLPTTTTTKNHKPLHSILIKKIQTGLKMQTFSKDEALKSIKSCDYKRLGKEFIGEFAGTAIFMVFGLSSLATIVLSGTFNFFQVGVTYGFGVMMAVYVAAPISGAHLNPGMTLALWVIRRFPLYKVPVYIVAQYLGGFLASAIVYGVYVESIHALDAKVNAEQNSTGPTQQSAAIFISFPAPHISVSACMADQIVMIGLVAFSILFISDDSCFETAPAVKIMNVGLAIVAFVVGFCYQCGSLMNPAREVPPRVFLYMVGYGDIAFRSLDGKFWWAVGICAVHISCIAGSILYVLLAKLRLSCHHESTLNQHLLKTKRTKQTTITTTTIMISRQFHTKKWHSKPLVESMAVTRSQLNFDNHNLN